ncbi:hypothetical protein B296_00036768 [Ensete ventricosum]|uniref:Uncharacterized protein n=1 Tax=Ensete ventricosum TaxID=4639 RepID=A0A426YIM4_ENSVE|nr:hypothetical protein B296_00036768 [Ensete ventricosum]
MTFSPTYSFDVLIEAAVDVASPHLLLDLQSSALPTTRLLAPQLLSVVGVELSNFDPPYYFNSPMIDSALTSIASQTRVLSFLASVLLPCPGTYSLPLYSPPPPPLSRPTLSLHKSKGSMTLASAVPWRRQAHGLYPLPCSCVPFFAIDRSTYAALWHSSEFTSFLTDALLLGS